MRKPHIFISSRLKLGNSRQKIKELLEESGLSAKIYEKDSTPSNEPATYLRDITEADFAIFVLDETYGTPRKATGISGVHEEWNRVREHRIPRHVYLKRSSGSTPDRRQKRFIESELVSAEISYYYDSVKELLAQIRSSLVKMIFDIAHSSAYRARLDPRSVIADVVQRDHEAFSHWDRALVTLREYEETMPERVTDAWGSLGDLFTLFNPEKVDPFLDGKAQELFARLIHFVSKLSEHDSRHIVPPGKPGGTIVFPSGPCDITVYVPMKPLPHDFFDSRVLQKKKIFEKWEEIGALIGRRYSRYAQF